MDAFSDPFTTFDSPPNPNTKVQVNSAPMTDAWGSPQPQQMSLAAHGQAPGTPQTDAWGSPQPQPNPPFAAQAGFTPLGTQTTVCVKLIISLQFCRLISEMLLLEPRFNGSTFLVRENL